MAPRVQQGALPHGEVPPRVLGQVVAAHETAVAHGTGEPLLPGVGAVVARQLVGARELPLAVFPLASEGLLTCSETNSVSVLCVVSLSHCKVSPVCVLMWALRWELLK